MIFLISILTFYSILSSGLLIRNHYRYLNYVPSDRPEFNCDEGRHNWSKWIFKQTTNIYDGDKVVGALPIRRENRYIRTCEICGEPGQKILKS